MASRHASGAVDASLGHDRFNEFLVILSLALAALISVSLLSFDPLDKSYFVEPEASLGPTRNLAGQVGAQRRQLEGARLK